MTGHRLEVADVFRDHGLAFLDEFGDALSPEQRRVLSDLAACRTAALGGHVEACDRCGHQRISYNSCRNRHCPKCQGTAAAQWLDARATELLPTEYFHVVFTLPEAIGPIALQNPRVVYGILFRAAAETLLQVAADPKRLGAEIGFLAVLHTWGQNLHHHPMFIVSSPEAGCRLRGHGGSPVQLGSSSRSASSVASSGASSWHGSARRLMRASWPSTVSRVRCQMRASSSDSLSPAPRPTGWFTPSRRSAVPSKC